MPIDPLEQFRAETVLAQLHGFQRDAVEYVFDRLFTAEDSTRRFLVADEVGLGKTLIARGILAKALEHLKDKVERIDVVYVCSNLSIAAQNIARLNPVEGLEFSDAERITLLPIHLSELEKSRVNFVAFTPGTSLDMGFTIGMRRERILLYLLLERHWRLTGVAALNVLQGNVASATRFRERVSDFSRRHKISETLARAFFQALDQQPELRQEFEAVCELFPREREHVPREHRKVRNAIIGKLRATLATACIGMLEPDLVVLDEFQRFKSLLDPETEEGELAHHLFNWSTEHARAHVLLLSATPYKAYTLQHEVAEEDHYADFLRTVEFLDNDSLVTGRLKELLGAYRRELYRLREGNASELQRVKQEIETHLRRVMSRTERLSAGAEENGMLRPVIHGNLPTTCEDLEAYAALRGLAGALEVDDALEYWKSAAYPLSFMGGYELRETLDSCLESGKLDDALLGAISRSARARMPVEKVRKYEALEKPPNARYRDLLGQLEVEGAFDALWLSPSLPYYRLEGPFAGSEQAKKRLIFSAWHIVPRSLSTLLSYECERRAFGHDEESPENSAEARRLRRGLLRFSESEGRLTGLPIFALIYPSKVLARLCDPREYCSESGTSGSLDDVLRWAMERIRRTLPAGMQYAAENQVADERWYWAAPILLDVHSEEGDLGWWRDATNGLRWVGKDDDEDDRDEAEDGFKRHIAEAAKLVASKSWPSGSAPSDLVRVLALIGLAAPATCAFRALERLFADRGPTAVLAKQDSAARVGWGFRSLFNRPESMAVIRRRRRDPYWLMALEYCAAGCLSSVLDEYLHVVRDASGQTAAKAEVACPKIAKPVLTALQIRTASLDSEDLSVELGSRKVDIRKFAMRTLFAMRFGSDKTEDAERVRRDTAVSAAFNSPFWPFVLATTSVGQEGLDFHWYCHTVVHWNLPSNPVDLEQREGRVHRFKGRAIRLNVARLHGMEAISSEEHDLWSAIFQRAAQAKSGGERGLVPYWLYPIKDGAWIERYVPLHPFSKDSLRYVALQRSLGAYRMVFGQPRQDELLAYLLRQTGSEQLSSLSRLLMIDLAPPRESGAG